MLLLLLSGRPNQIESNRNRIAIASNCSTCCSPYYVVIVVVSSDCFVKGKHIFPYSNCCEAKHTRRVAGKQTSECGKWQAVTPPPAPPLPFQHSSVAEEPAVAAGLHRNIDFHTCAAYPARSKCPSQAAACRVGPRRAGTSCCCSFAESPRTPVVRQHVLHIAAQTAVRRLLLSLATLRPCNISHCSQTSVGSTMCVRVCVCAFAGTLCDCVAVVSGRVGVLAASCCSRGTTC